ncbi:MAG: TIGR02301 family protein [Caulobacter sp.]|nr:TIGR02301 family protein [Caulobacter sp.]
MSRSPLPRLSSVVLVVAALAAPAAAAAQDRAPAERQQLLELAFTIGESHALRQLCLGAGDQYWRSRMVRLTEVEKADQAFDAQLRDRFNTGFAAGQGEFPTCDEDARRAAEQSARKGQALSAKLARAMRTASPDQGSPESVADEEAAR